MVKTSITDYVVGGIMASCIIAVFILFYVYADVNYDIGEVNTEGLNSYGNFSEITRNANQSSGMVYDINADSSLFDVLGALVVKSLSAIKSFISGIKFMTSNIGNILGNGMLHIPPPIKVAVLTIIVFLIAAVFLFKHLAKTDDEK